MKTNKVSLFVIAQVIILFLFVGQYYLIDSFGKSFNIYVDNPYEYYGDEPYEFYGDDFNSNIYVEYDISEIPKNIWKIDGTLNYNDLVYVMLEKDEKGVYVVTDAADHKLTVANEEQAVLKAYYVYDHAGKNYVDYRFKNEINENYFTDVEQKQPMIAHFKRAPWGQFKLVSIENIE